MSLVVSIVNVSSVTIDIDINITSIIYIEYFWYVFKNLFTKQFIKIKNKYTTALLIIFKIKIELKLAYAKNKSTVFKIKALANISIFILIYFFDWLNNYS